MKTIRNMILLIALFLLIPFTPIHASSDVYVEDTYGALSQEEVDELNAYAAQIADQYKFGVYARIIEDSTEQSYDDMTNFIEKYYTDESLGYGNTDNGVLLLITQCSKGGSYQVYIPYCDKQSMFSLDGMDIMDSAARSGLYEHDYYSAIRDYIKEADGLMAYYSENGEHYGSNYDEPADSTPIKKGITFGLPPIIALITVLAQKSKHKTKAIATTAHSYVPGNGVHLTNSRDMFLYESVTRAPIPKHDDNDSSPGGSSFSSSGGMHSGGGHF